MENIIRKAIDGGWQPKSHPQVSFKKDSTIQAFCMVTSNAFVLDPLFWQALGKSCGWNPNATRVEGTAQYSRDPEWMSQASRFYRINLTEGWEKAVEYLSDLIK